jgi:hypothetical protein
LLQERLTSHVADRCPDNYRRTVVYDLRFPYSAQRLVASRQLFRDQAVTNAHQLADLLTSANLPVSEPGG